LGIVTEVKPLHPENAHTPIEVTLEGIVTEVKAEQSSNAPSPIEVTLSGIVTEVKPLHPENAFFPIEVTGRPLNVEGITRLPEMSPVAERSHCVIATPPAFLGACITHSTITLITTMPIPRRLFLFIAFSLLKYVSHAKPRMIYYNVQIVSIFYIFSVENAIF
jgi:hypothetical protein